MAKDKIGIQMIEMYSSMVKNDFEPIFQALEIREQALRNRVRDQVRRDFGIYELHAEKEAMELRLQEINKQLDEYERPDRFKGDKGGRYISLVEAEVEQRMSELDSPRNKARAKMEGIVRSIKLAGVRDDIKEVFNQLPGTIAELRACIGSLPAPDQVEIPAQITEE